MSKIGRALRSVDKHWTCQICGSEYPTQKKAVECADQCLAEKERRNNDIRKVQA